MANTDGATMIRKAITAETDKVTKIVDDITPEGLDMLEESIGEILTKHKAYLLESTNTAQSSLKYDISMKCIVFTYHLA